MEDLQEIIKNSVIGNYGKGYVMINGTPYDIKELADLVEAVSDLQNELVTLLNIKVKED